MFTAGSAGALQDVGANYQLHVHGAHPRSHGDTHTAPRAADRWPGPRDSAMLPRTGAAGWVPPCGSRKP